MTARLNPLPPSPHVQTNIALSNEEWDRVAIALVESARKSTDFEYKMKIVPIVSKIAAKTGRIYII